MKRIFRRCLDDESGVTAIEYGLIASLISIAAVGVYPGVGAALNVVFGNVVTGFP
jgi:pilus assembly protein Flp/PilA